MDFDLLFIDNDSIKKKAIISQQIAGDLCVDTYSVSSSAGTATGVLVELAATSWTGSTTVSCVDAASWKWVPADESKVLRQKELNQGAIALLDSWLQEPEDNDNEELEQLITGLERNRLSGRKLFR